MENLAEIEVFRQTDVIGNANRIKLTMNSIIIKPQNTLLQSYVEYFLFFKKSDAEYLTYTTFPNNNLCLAIYRQNQIDYINQSGQNDCNIKPSTQNFISRFYGFHKMPFHVSLQGTLDQICILFYPSAIRAFTGETYHNLTSSENAFDILTKETTFLEEVFEESNFKKRAVLLENLLLNKLNDKIPDRLKKALFIIDNNSQRTPKVSDLSQQLNLSSSSLYRLFKNHLGYSPKNYLETIRFRRSLNSLLNCPRNLTDVAYSNHFFDQAHFINDFKRFSGFTPRKLADKILIEQQQLAWIKSVD